jgi:hypothetical protein
VGAFLRKGGGSATAAPFKSGLEASGATGLGSDLTGATHTSPAGLAGVPGVAEGSGAAGVAEVSTLTSAADHLHEVGTFAQVRVHASGGQRDAVRM